MSDINKVTLTGRVAGEPDTHRTETGKLVVTFTLAVSYDHKATTGEKKPIAANTDVQGTSLPWREMAGTNNRNPRGETSFIDVVVLGKLAEGCSQFLKKGKKVLVEGRIQQRKGVQVLAHQVYYLTSLYEGRKDVEGLPHEELQQDLQGKVVEEPEG